MKPPSDCQARFMGASPLPTWAWANHRAWSPPWHATVRMKAPAAWAEVTTAAGLSTQKARTVDSRCQPCSWLTVHRSWSVPVATRKGLPGELPTVSGREATAGAPISTPPGKVSHGPGSLRYHRPESVPATASISGALLAASVTAQGRRAERSGQSPDPNEHLSHLPVMVPLIAGSGCDQLDGRLGRLVAPWA